MSEINREETVRQARGIVNDILAAPTAVQADAIVLELLRRVADERDERATLARRVTELETTLRSLRNEGYAILALSSDEIKHSAGYTNLKCFEDRLSEATLALLNAPPVRD